ncbi:threonine synthase [Pseudoalteromonas sp. SR44-5]|jgi:threonine synthase|uniref:threonine synthase n=1 Tax=Pseudoalteromonas TaxID=53246 RepID=UPI0016020D3C|nr:MULTISPECIES: threonine synthase [Pseudoalteromonas]MBB1293161.1 threonine synthase [Pseudoalteromonas sp. SR41-4]MBB1302179.1 threonine synthase [Pseudoalteromonas sp. SR44-8]MBB1333631.1 threonine synthase [Pseudoalteromonas sp. SR41-6]MBB1366908.1 threonine synthase [Pseudoalteromonas sp. SR44-5]MBB1408356.1 threonine synthase [Pseudoalteromonas sp. SG44-17]|tara:strand:- start:13472 stop:14755 length:1284 start_codon:yes stop_codon:yes gene_type:complete
MQLHNLKDDSQKVSFVEAVKTGLGRNQGVFFPESLAPLADVDSLLDMDFVTRSSKILSHLIGDELPADTVAQMVQNAFNFPVKLVEVEDNIYCLELFHGPTLAFKDFGGRFMAECLAQFSQGEKTTILTATSGDTGAAVAHAFYNKPNIDVVILYPKGKISLAQQKLFTTLGNNIHCYAVDGSFDDCQAMVKNAFLDDEVKSRLGLNSANSINISRLVAQVCYYFEAIAQLPKEQRAKAHISIPSGNFGNVCAAMIGAVIGLPVAKLSATTNQNDTVPRFILDKNWAPNATIESLSNAMDVSKPNNWPRVQTMLDNKWFSYDDFYSTSVDENDTQAVMKKIHQTGYVAEPHTAIAYQGLKANLATDSAGIFLATAHPAKFKESVEEILNIELEMPKPLADALAKPCLAEDIADDYDILREILLAKLG